MLNNKYLAIVLSIIAIFVVVYQVFIRKPEKVTRPLPNEPIISTQGRPNQVVPPVSTPPQTGDSSDESDSPAPRSMNPPSVLTATDGLVIDFNSDILQKRVEPGMNEPFPRSELPEEFGAPIFSSGSAPGSEPGSEDQYTREIEFRLNAIIIDQQRRMAIINDQIVKIGDTILGATVVSIVKSEVVLMIEKTTVVLSTNSRIKKIRLVESKKQGGKQGEQ